MVETVWGVNVNQSQEEHYVIMWMVALNVHQIEVV